MFGVTDRELAAVASQLRVLPTHRTWDRPVATIRPEFGIAFESLVFGFVVVVFVVDLHTSKITARARLVALTSEILY